MNELICSDGGANLGDIKKSDVDPVDPDRQGDQSTTDGAASPIKL